MTRGPEKKNPAAWTFRFPFDAYTVEDEKNAPAGHHAGASKKKEKEKMLISLALSILIALGAVGYFGETQNTSKGINPVQHSE